MKKNMGKVDKTVRILIALTIGALYFADVLSGTLAIILGGLSLIFVVTSFLSFCPLYIPFGISTCGKNE